MVDTLLAPNDILDKIRDSNLPEDRKRAAINRARELGMISGAGETPTTVPQTTPATEAPPANDVLKKIRESGLPADRQDAMLGRARELGLVGEGGSFTQIGSPPKPLKPPKPPVTKPGQEIYADLTPTERLVVGSLQTVRRGAFDIANLPAHGLNMIEGIFAKVFGGKPTKFFTIEEMITQLAGRDNPATSFIEPRTSLERFLFRAGRESTAAALTAGSTTLRKILGPSQKVIQSRGVGRVVAEETVLGGLTGVAGQTAQELDLGIVGEIAAQLMAGFAGFPAAAKFVDSISKLPNLRPRDIAAVGRAIAKLPETTRNRILVGGEAESRLSDFVMTQLRREGLDEVADRLETAIARQENIPGFRPTLGQATDSPGLRRLETSGQLPLQDQRAAAALRATEERAALIQNMESQLEIPAAATATDEIAEQLTPRLQRRLAELESDTAALSAPLQQQRAELPERATEARIGVERRLTAQETAVTERLTTSARERAARVTASIDRRLNRAHQGTARIAQTELKSGRRFVASETGQTVRAEVQGVFDDFSKEAGKRFDPFTAPDLRGTTPDLFDGIENTRLRAEADQSLGDFPSTEIAEFRRSVTQGVEPTGDTPLDLNTLDVTFDQLKRLRTNLLERQRRGGPSFYTNAVIEDVHTAMQKVAADSGRADLIEAFDAARAWYRENIRKFVTGVGSDILQKSHRTFEGFRVSNSNIAERIVGSPTREKIEQFVQLTQGRPNAQAALTEYLSHDLFLAVGDKPTQVALNRWRAKHAPTLLALDEAGLPEVGQKFDTLQRAQRRVDEVVASSKRIEGALQKTTAPGAVRKEAARELSAARETAQRERGAITAQTQEVRQGLTQELTGINQSRRASEQEAIRRYFGRAGDVETDPAKITTALNVRDPARLTSNVRELMSITAGDDIAQRGVRRALADSLWRRAGGDGAKFVAVLDQNRAAMASAGFGPSALQTLREYGEAIKTLRPPTSTGTTAPAATAEVNALFVAPTIERQFGQVGRQGGRIVGAVGMGTLGFKQQGFVGAGVGAITGAEIGKGILQPLAGALGGSLGRKIDSTMATLIEEAVFNPDLQRTLDAIRRAQGAPDPLLRARLHSHLVQLGIGSRSEESSEQ